jgi:hypothetical protein
MSDDNAVTIWRMGRHGTIEKRENATPSKTGKTWATPNPHGPSWAPFTSRRAEGWTDDYRDALDDAVRHWGHKCGELRERLENAKGRADDFREALRRLDIKTGETT